MTYFEVKLEPITVKYEEESTFTETYGFVGSQGVVVLEGIYLGKNRDNLSSMVFGIDV